MSTLPLQTIPLLGFAPDMPYATQGALYDVENLTPTASGFAGAPEPFAVADILGGSAGYVTGCAISDNPGVSGVVQYLWTTVSSFPAARSSYTQFGNKVVKASPGLNAQIGDITSSAAMADIPTAPQAYIAVSAANFVLLFNTRSTYPSLDSSFTPDQWWCCAINDPTSWTPSVTTQATSGRLVDGSGSIVAAKRLGDTVVALKNRSLYVGQYVGPPVVWQWSRVPGASGCFGAMAACDIGGQLFFAGEAGLFIFDGSRAVPLGVGVIRDWFLADIHPTMRSNVECVYDPVSMQVWVWYPSRASEITYNLGPGPVVTTLCDKALIYDLRTQKWGLKTGVTIHTTVQITSFDTSNTAPSMGDLPATFETLAQAHDRTQKAATGGILAVTADGKVSRFTSESSGCKFSTWDMGDEDFATQVRSLRLHYVQIPPVGTVTGYTKTVSPNGEQRQSSSGTLRDGKFDCRQNARWHHFKFDLTGQAEVSGLRVEMAQAGRR